MVDNIRHQKKQSGEVADLSLWMENGLINSMQVYPKKREGDGRGIQQDGSGSVQLLSRVLLCDPMDCSMPGLPVHCRLLEFTQTHIHWVSDANQPFYPLSSPSLPAFSLSQHQGLFKWVISSHLVAKVLEFQLQNQSFQ